MSGKGQMTVSMIFGNDFFADSVHLTNVPTLPRKRRPTCCTGSGTDPFYPDALKDYFMYQYYEALDIVIAELNG